MKNMLSFLTVDNSPLPLTIILIIIGAVLLAVILSLIVLFILCFKSKKKKISTSGDVWLLALGEKDNIKEITAIGSRLSISLLDKEKIDREKLKELGVSNILVMSNKITLVIEGQAEKVAALIQKQL